MIRSKAAKIVLISISALLILALLCVTAWYIAYKALENTGLPRLDVVTEDGAKIVSKEDYVNCLVSLSGAEEEYSFSEKSAGIRGRGNTTWTHYPKKPYRIKFDEKTSIFGEEKNKSWVLLALYNDLSLIKDRLAFTVADSLGTDAFVPSYNYVDLYINGVYMGVYLFTDQVDENKGRASVKSDFTETDTEVPFLVELDEYAPDEGEEGVVWFDVGGRYYSVKYPEADERYTDEQFEYIEGYIKTVDSLCRRKNVTMEELSEYLDMDRFIDFYIVEELMGQTEINYKSVYMSKAVGEKLKMGPVWDFDWAVNGPFLGEYANTNIENVGKFCSGDNWFGALYNGSAEFRAALSKRWTEVREDVIAAVESVKADKESLIAAAKRDCVRWFFTRGYYNYGESFDLVIEWVEKRILWLDEAFFR